MTARWGLVAAGVLAWAVLVAAAAAAGMVAPEVAMMSVGVLLAGGVGMWTVGRMLTWIADGRWRLAGRLVAVVVSVAVPVLVDPVWAVVTAWVLVLVVVDVREHRHDGVDIEAVLHDDLPPSHVRVIHDTPGGLGDEPGVAS